MRRIILFWLQLVFALQAASEVTAFSQDDGCGESQTLTLDECQRLARENYPLIRRYELLEQTKQFTLSNIQKGWMPQVSFSVQATYQSDVVALPEALENMMAQYGKEVVGIKKDQYRVSLDVQQTIYDGGVVRSRKGVAEAQTEAEKSKNDVDMYALRERVNSLYFMILLLDEKIALSVEMQQSLQANEDKLSEMVKGGTAMECDMNSVRAERLTVRQEQTRLEEQRAAVRQVLGVFVGRDVTDVVKPEFVSGEVGQGARRPELTYFDRQIGLTQQQEEALKSGLTPKLVFFAQGYYGYPGMNMYEDMFSHKWSLNGLIGARLTWNMSSLYTNKNDKRKLESQRQEIETQRETFMFNQRMQTTQERGAIESYRKMLQEDDEIIELREGVRQSAEAKLRLGTVDVSGLVQEITRESQAKINKSVHEIELLQHIYNLKYITNE